MLSTRPLALEAIVENDRVVTRTQHVNRLTSLLENRVATRTPPFRSAPLNRQTPIEELSAALGTLATHSAAGPDNVYHDSLVHLPPLGKRMLLSVMNKSLVGGIVPLLWRQQLHAHRAWSVSTRSVS